RKLGKTICIFERQVVLETCYVVKPSLPCLTHPVLLKASVVHGVDRGNGALSLQDFDAVELLDLLFDQADGILWSEEKAGRQTWPAPGVVPQGTHGDGDGVSAGDLLSVPDSLSGSLQWSHSPSDSGIGEDPPSDQTDSPPPSDSPALHTAPLPLSRHDYEEPDVTINLGYGSKSESPCGHSAIPLPPMPPISTGVPLTIKDLLLLGTNEPPPAPSQQPLQELILNEDEKKLLAKEGVSLSSQLPLTKMEERILKKIRRKIRNKHSAQESRKKKKEYIDTLEGRMAACSAHNQELQRKVLQLEKSNTSLMEQLRRLQALLMTASSKTAQTSTCVLVLLLSFLLILVPSLQPFSSSGVSPAGDFSSARGQVSHFSPHNGRQALSPLSVDGGVEPIGSLLAKEEQLPETNGIPQNRSVEERDHGRHGDPITGHAATVTWSSRQDAPLRPHADDM
uniref:cAMP responsive element binding protein 3 like 3 n=1 Tax=Scleropages formosus TaxID=113540 RepID=A0A8C9WQV9_SCLFO